jgi:hypothetical protein
MMSNLRTADYAITDNAPNFWIQHKTDGFVCQVVYGEHEKPDVTERNRARALGMANKIINALQQFDDNNA